MQIKLCRVWHLLHPYYVLESSFYFFGLCCSFLCFLLGLLPFSLETVFASVLLGAFFVLMLWSVVIRFPKEFTVEKDEIRYCQKQRTGSTFFRTRINCYLRYTKGKLTFVQNPLEKLFNVGHIIYEGEDYCECEDYVLVRPYIFKKHRIYGIPNFSEFKKSFAEYTKIYNN